MVFPKQNSEVPMLGSESKLEFLKKFLAARERTRFMTFRFDR